MNFLYLRASMLLIFCFVNYVQIQAQFFLNGSAIAVDSCFQLTTAENVQVGSIWNGEKIDLTESFEINVDLFAGCMDELGADGLVFGLQPISTSIGTGGGDIGFGDVVPSLGVEFDTYQNIDYADPVFDHIAVVRDGNLRHNTPQGSLAGPVQANANNPNIEDCEFHPMRVLWDASLQTLTVYLDCELRLSYTADIVTEIFNGDPMVFWGFTAATGGLNNVHEICFSYTSILDGLVDETICPGTSTQLEATGGNSYQWSPTTGVSDPNIADPVFSPEETTLYTVEITDDCGIPFFDDVLITVENAPFDVEIINSANNPVEVLAESELEFSANVVLPDGENYTYSWSSEMGSTFANADSSNTIVMVSSNTDVTETLTVVVTDENGCTGEASIDFEILGATFDIPNAFTPNGDSTNDVFGLITNATTVNNFSCKIFNRWGDLVFETNNHLEFWDGTKDDNALSSDVYVYLLNFEIEDVLYNENGDVTLIR